MKLYVTDPLSGSRWDDLVAQHRHASIFHERGWLEALVRTYGYAPFVLTTSAPGEPLRNGIVLCRVSSWITGTRAVSLPFADHCQPLLAPDDDCAPFAGWLQQECDHQHWKYVELRPLLPRPTNSGTTNSGATTRDDTIDHDTAESSSDAASSPPPSGRSYGFHVLDLTPPLDQLFSGLHKSSMQRRIRKAEKESLSYEVGSRELLEPFYGLLVMTRKRHQLIPQPRAWFQNLIACLGDKLEIRLARKDGRPIAAMLSLRHRSTVTYKYGCSDHEFHHLAGMPFLFWKLIEESRNSGATSLDLGRSDLDQSGLLTFKNHLGAKQQTLTYFRYPQAAKSDVTDHAGVGVVRRVLSLVPDVALPVAGSVLYRHLG